MLHLNWNLFNARLQMISVIELITMKMCSFKRPTKNSIWLIGTYNYMLYFWMKPIFRHISSTRRIRIQRPELSSNTSWVAFCSKVICDRNFSVVWPYESKFCHSFLGLNTTFSTFEKDFNPKLRSAKFHKILPFPFKYCELIIII